MTKKEEKNENQVASDFPSKKCGKCKADKPVSEFNKRWANTDGLEGFCRECQLERGRTYEKRKRAAAEMWGNIF